MPIDITGFSNSQTPNTTEGAAVKPAHKEPTPQQQETGNPVTRDTVNLTDAAQQLKKLEASLASVPVVDAQRVESIRQAIANGSYEINPERVAEQMLAFESALFGKGEK